MMNFIIMLVIITINIFTLYKLFFKMIFRDFDDFNESIRYSLTPDLFSLFRREYIRDRMGEFKLGFFIMLCLITTLMEYAIINNLVMRIGMLLQ